MRIHADPDPKHWKEVPYLKFLDAAHPDVCRVNVQRRHHLSQLGGLLPVRGHDAYFSRLQPKPAHRNFCYQTRKKSFGSGSVFGLLPLYSLPDSNVSGSLDM